MIAIFATLALLAAPQQARAVPASATSELLGLHDFGACVARDYDKAGELLSVVPGTSRENDVILDLVRKGCPSINEFTLEPDLLRGIVAEALFKQDFGSLGASARRPAAAVFVVPEADRLNGLPRNAQHKVGVIAYAACVVETAPQQTMAVLRSQPGSSGEGAALAALGPTLGPCLPDGMTVEFTRPRLRGALAEAAYRMAASAK
ncbi:MAG: hypothetical protein V4574_12685 [Pseudomonadota bacterium]